MTEPHPRDDLQNDAVSHTVEREATVHDVTGEASFDQAMAAAQPGDVIRMVADTAAPLRISRADLRDKMHRPRRLRTRRRSYPRMPIL